MRTDYPFNTKPCARCGEQIGRQHHLSKYCRPCQLAPKRVSSPERRIGDDRARLVVGGQLHCKDCLQPMQSVDPQAPGYTGELRDRQRPRRCAECFGRRSFIKATFVAKAGALVKKAVKKGLLPHPATLLCADCGKQADVFDHRDYNKPLDVVPVCRSCNVLRGPAIFPHPYEAYGAPLTTPCPLCEREQQGSYFAARIRRVHFCRAGIYVGQVRHIGTQSTRAA